MKKLFVLGFCSFLMCAALATDVSSRSLDIISPRRVEQVSATRAGEGPAWQASTKSLFFTGDNCITRLDANGVSHVFREPSGGANGLAFDHQGRLVVCESARRRITRTEADGSITVLADNYGGRPFNSPNDLAIDAQGRIYFTDPRYGSREGMGMVDGNEKLVEGVYRIDAPGSVSRVLSREVERPNGILVTPDGKHLYVADNNNNALGGARKLWRFDLNADGSVHRRSKKLIFDWKTSRGPDGLKMGADGRLYVAAGLNKANPPFETVEPYPAGIYILTKDGEFLEHVPIPKDEVTNCAIAGSDLYITAGGTLWKMALP